MDYATAYHLVIDQVKPYVETDLNPKQGLIDRLREGKPPIPGQVTSILLALKVIYEGLRGVSNLERELVLGLYRLAYESQYWYDQGRKNGTDWPPLLDTDLRRIAKAVSHIFSDRWE